MPPSQTPKILLVEDEFPLARVYQEYLKNESYQIITANNGKTALDAIDNEMPDAVILDLKLPDKDGIILAPSQLTGIWAQVAGIFIRQRMHSVFRSPIPETLRKWMYFCSAKNNWSMLCGLAILH